MAEEERFELSIPCGMLAFQASALGHYATPPHARTCRLARRIRYRVCLRSGDVLRSVSPGETGRT
jgi:hypothetical protein